MLLERNFKLVDIINDHAYFMGDNHNIIRCELNGRVCSQFEEFSKELISHNISKNYSKYITIADSGYLSSPEGKVIYLICTIGDDIYYVDLEDISTIKKDKISIISDYNADDDITNRYREIYNSLKVGNVINAESLSHNTFAVSFGDLSLSYSPLTGFSQYNLDTSDFEYKDRVCIDNADLESLKKYILKFYSPVVEE